MPYHNRDFHPKALLELRSDLNDFNHLALDDLHKNFMKCLHSTIQEFIKDIMFFYPEYTLETAIRDEVIDLDRLSKTVTRIANQMIRDSSQIYTKVNIKFSFSSIRLTARYDVESKGLLFDVSVVQTF